MEKRKRPQQNRIPQNDPPPVQEGYYDDYYPDPEAVAAEEEARAQEAREHYYAQRDAYYARRDAYYARRDAYYARREAEEAEADWYYPTRPRRPRREDTDQRDYQPEDMYDSAGPVRRGRTKRRARRAMRLLRTLLLLALAGALVLMLTSVQPVLPEEGRTRIAGRSTILLAGTDQEGVRTDNILLLALDQPSGTASLLSIPGEIGFQGDDTLRLCDVYGAAGGGSGGMDALRSAVRDVVGFLPDGYVLLDMDVLSEAVDLLGGVEFEIPSEYADRAAELYQDIRSGLQHLSGRQVMELFRTRIGGNSDPEQMRVQRQVVREALRQWFHSDRWKVFPKLWELFRSRMTSNLSFRQVMWIARVLAKSDLGAMAEAVVPGELTLPPGAGEDDSQVRPLYLVDADALAALLDAYSPYE